VEGSDFAASGGYSGLNDRGVIEAGMRADSVLIGGDPVGDIRITRGIIDGLV